jgi:uncharacterized protein (DUF302 family)
MQTNDNIKTEKHVEIIHIKRTSLKPFGAVLAAFEERLGSPTIESINEAVSNKVAETVIKAMEGESHLMILGMLDMGAALPSFKEKNRKGRQYLVGNPLFADKMIKQNSEVGLYVPLRIFMVEEENGTSFIYDLPSSLLGQWCNAEIDKTAKELDKHLTELVDYALDYSSAITKTK